MEPLLRIAIVFCLFVVACKPVTPKPTDGSADNPSQGTSTDIKGYFDNIDANGFAAGWALSQKLGAQSISIAVYADGDYKTGRRLSDISANLPRPDVNAALKVSGDHGFRFAIPGDLRDGLPHKLYIYGVNGTDTGLLGPTLTFTLTAIQPPPLDEAHLPDPSKATYDAAFVYETVRMLYLGLLWREPDYPGANGYISDVHAGNTLGSVQSLLSSQEFQDNMIGVSRADFVMRLYKVFFKRDLDPSGYQSYVLSHSSYESIALALAASPEFASRNDAYRMSMKMKFMVFQADLWRDPGTEIDGFIADIFSGNLPNTIYNVATSGEFNTNTLPKGREAIVQHFYQVILGRDIDPGAEDAYVTHTDVSLPQVAKLLVMSDEFKAHMFFENKPPVPPVTIRNGIVRADHRSIHDDDGYFYPLGATLFWALRGWKFERDRVKANLQFLAKHHFDYIRILGEVDWSGNDIDPAWPDYDQNFAELVDYAYDTCGLRVEITMIGGGHENVATSLSQRIAGIIKDGREQKVMNFEVANESYGRNISLDQMREIGRYWRQNFPDHLVALSSAEGTGTYQNSGDFIKDVTDVWMKPGTANLVTIHMDRGFGDDGWRAVRQPWDWKDLDFPVSHNEPIGPRSSVAQDDDPIRQAMLRAVGLINGVTLYVLHNASGVAGQVDPAHDRPANLWEVPNIDNVMDAVRGIDAFMPARVGEGQHWNNAWGGNPWVADAFWASGDNHGVNRNYTVATPDGWVSTEAGVKDYTVFTSSRHALVEVFDVLQGKVMEVELQAGQTFRLAPVSTDSGGYGAFIIIGHYR